MLSRVLIGSLLPVVLAANARGDLRASLVASGIQNPTHMTQPPGDDRMFVTAMRQGIWIVENGVILPERFLDMTPLDLASQGVKSMAFHPDYSSNGLFYVVYLDNDLYNHVVEYQVSAADPYKADPSSARQILGPYAQTAVVHNWNEVTFGPDGYLYVSTGDGLLSPDVSINNGQRLDVLAGKILRIDVDQGMPYAIPPDNPFVGMPGAREEIWMYGLRQPWRYDRDPMNGDLYISDVGNGDREEINVAQASGGLGGQNFGWRCLEGSVCENLAPGCLPCSNGLYLPPVHEYDTHSEGRCAVIGGRVYRGALIPELFGKYIFADHCSSRFWTFRYAGGSATEFEEVQLPTDAPYGITLPVHLSRDHDGELYVVDRANGGNLWKIEEDPCQILTSCDGQPNSTGSPAVLGTLNAPDVTSTDFTLQISGGPPGQNVLFFYGGSAGSMPFGNGTRCVFGTTYRLNPPTLFDANGVASHVVDFSAPPHASGTIQPGSLWYFQGWYRDPAAGGFFFNLSSSLSIRFCP